MRAPKRIVRWPPVVPVMVPKLLPVAVLKPVLGLPQRTEFVTLYDVDAEFAVARAAEREPLEERRRPAARSPDRRGRCGASCCPARRPPAASTPTYRSTGRPGPSCADDLLLAVEIHERRVARRVELAVAADRQRLAGLRDEEAAHLPAADDLAERAVAHPPPFGSPRQFVDGRGDVVVQAIGVGSRPAQIEVDRRADAGVLIRQSSDWPSV